MKRFVVQIIESERGWGSRVDEEIHFDSEREAKEWVRAYNIKYNSSNDVPDWYMVAAYAGEQEVDGLNLNPPYSLNGD